MVKWLSSAMRSDGYGVLVGEDGESFCRAPLDEMFELPLEPAVFWLAVTSQKPRDDKWVAVWVRRVEGSTWLWSLRRGGTNGSMFWSVNRLLDSYFPDGGTHKLYLSMYYEEK